MGKQLRDALRKIGIAGAAKKPGPTTDRNGTLHLPGKEVENRKQPVLRTPAAAAQPPRPARQNRVKPLARSGLTLKQQEDYRKQLEALEHAYGAPKRVKAVSLPAGECSIRKIGPFRPHPLFAEGPENLYPRLTRRHDGIGKELSAKPSDEADMVLGLDFGTSCTKAVIRDGTDRRGFLVEFTGNPENGFLLQSRVYQTGDVYSLDKGGTCVRDLKLGLLNAISASPVAEFNNACAFLALVIRHCRGWFFDTYGPKYRQHRLSWRLNLGLPARSYEDEKIVRLFRRLAWAAANCAASLEPAITAQLVDRIRQESNHALADADGAGSQGYEFCPHDTDVVPEIAAQITGFVGSAKWDWAHRPMMMMVDIGAGTVDAAFFSVGGTRGRQLRFTFFANEVRQLGVMNLHRERVKWLNALLQSSKTSGSEVTAYLDRIAQPTDRLIALPDLVQDYLGGFHFGIPPGALTIDDDFFRHRYSAQVFGCIRKARQEKGIPDGQLRNLPIFMCGGGSRMTLFAAIANQINTAPINVSIEQTALPMPNDLEAEMLAAAQYDRVAVAYGLSLEGAGGEPLGKYVRSIDVPPVLSKARLDFESRFIDKSMM